MAQINIYKFPKEFISGWPKVASHSEPPSLPACTHLLRGSIIQCLKAWTLASNFLALCLLDSDTHYVWPWATTYPPKPKKNRIKPSVEHEALRCIKNFNLELSFRHPQEQGDFHPEGHCLYQNSTAFTHFLYWCWRPAGVKALKGF